MKKNKNKNIADVKLEHIVDIQYGKPTVIRYSTSSSEKLLTGAVDIPDSLIKVFFDVVALHIQEHGVSQYPLRGAREVKG